MLFYGVTDPNVSISDQLWSLPVNLIIVYMVTLKQCTKRHYTKPGHVCKFNFAFAVLKVNEILHPHRIEGVRKCINQADRKAVQIYVGRKVICFAEGLKQRG